MRWKLASGGVVATTKQPLQNKDFDRIEIVDSSYDDDFLFDFEYNKSRETNQYLHLSFTVNIINPSSRIKQRSHIKRINPDKEHRPITMITINNNSSGKQKENLGICGEKSGFDVAELHSGVNSFSVTPRFLCATESHTWTGFGCFHHETLRTPDDYDSHTYTVGYKAHLVLRGHHRFTEISQSEDYFDVEYKVKP